MLIFGMIGILAIGGSLSAMAALAWSIDKGGLTDMDAQAQAVFALSDEDPRTGLLRDRTLSTRGE